MSDAAPIWPSLEEARGWLQHGTGRGIKVAVLDSGVESSHPSLAGLNLADDLAVGFDGNRLNILPGEGRDAFGHGTAIAGIIHGLAPEAQIGSFRVLGQELRSRTMIIRAAALLAIERGYHILNCSFGCSREDHVLFYKDWIDEAYVRGRHIVAACNNQDFTKREWPAHFPTAITVNFRRCSTPEEIRYRRGHLAEFTANGQDIEVAWLGGTYKKVTGSSFAAPHVTGMLARLISGSRELSPLQAKALLSSLARTDQRMAGQSDAETGFDT
jgi:subtilisin family serine protease